MKKLFKKNKSSRKLVNLCLKKKNTKIQELYAKIQ